MKIKYLVFFILLFFLLTSPLLIYAQLSRDNIIITKDNHFINSDLRREFSDRIEVLMKENKIPGLAISIVKKDSVIWTDAFGVKRINTNDSINIETLFSLQSISKSITATTIMMAVQEGLVSLDTPIANYIMDFSVKSKFEEEPEKKITLRHLLSHRAGLTHEAPIGNNYQTEFDSFEKHIKSISKTWLKFKVGELYSYSNLGIDLAGYIIQVKSGMKFENYVKEKLFKPLKMKYTSFDWAEITDVENRAIGNSNKFGTIPLKFAMIPAGACYSNVIDMAKFIQFHLNKGTFDEEVILEAKYIDEMYNIPFCKSDIGYALGIEKSLKDDVYEYNHAGGGFGFQAVIKWIPEFDIGIAILTNSSAHNNIHKLIADFIISKLIPGYSVDKLNLTNNYFSDIIPITLSDEKYLQYSGFYANEEGNQEFELLLMDSIFGAQGERGIIPFNFINNEGDFFVYGISSEIDGEYRIVMDEKGDTPLYIVNKINRPILFFNRRGSELNKLSESNWDSYVGTYFRRMYGSPTNKHIVSIINGELYFDTFQLEEQIPNLFYASNGEVVDFRNNIPTYRNILLFKE